MAGRSEGIGGSVPPAAVDGGRGFVAPVRTARTSGDIKEGEHLSVSRTDPLYIFIPVVPDMATQLKEINKRSPFQVTAYYPKDFPERVKVPEGQHGMLLEVTIKRKSKAKIGAKDKVDLATTIFFGRRATAHHHFVIEVGPNRYYLTPPK